VKMWGEFC